MNISLYPSFVVHCYSHSMLPHISLSFVIVYLLFFGVPEIESSEKNTHIYIKRERKNERLTISFLMSVFVSYLGIVNTHAFSFFLHLSSYIIRTNRKKNDLLMKNVRWFTRIKKKKQTRRREEWRKGYTIESSNSIGIKKK